MPWTSGTFMDRHPGFVRVAEAGGVSVADLCRRFGINRGTGFPYLRRYREEGEAGLRDRLRRQHTSPRRTPPALTSTFRRLCPLRARTYSLRPCNADCGHLSVTCDVTDGRIVVPPGRRFACHRRPGGYLPAPPPMDVRPAAVGVCQSVTTHDLVFSTPTHARSNGSPARQDRAFGPTRNVRCSVPETARRVLAWTSAR